jgi:hypothetical protein
MSYASNIAYFAAAGQREFDFSFPYLERSHVIVTVNGGQRDFEWVSESRIRLLFDVPEGTAVVIRRRTPLDAPAVTFQNGSILTAEEQNRAIRQLLYGWQELDDLYNQSLNTARVRLGDNLGVVTDPASLVDELLRISELGDDLLNRFRDALTSIDLNASVITSQALRMDTLTSVVDALAEIGDGAGIATVIQDEVDARIEGDTALADRIALIGAVNSGNTAFILDMDSVMVSPTESLGQRYSAIYAETDNALALIQQEATARANALEAVTSTLDTLGVRVEGNEAAVVDEAQARADAISAEASARQALAALVGDVEAAVENEATVRANADEAIAETIAIMGAKNGAGTAFILDMNKVQVGGGQTFATRLSGIEAATDAAAAAVVTEQTARTTQFGALSGTLSTVQSQIGDQNVSITEIQQAAANLNGDVSAIAGLAFNVNGKISGWVSGNDGVTSTFDVQADVFRVSNGSSSVSPFTVSGNTVYFRNAVWRSGSSGERTEIDHNGGRVYDSAGTLRVRWGRW